MKTKKSTLTSPGLVFFALAVALVSAATADVTVMTERLSPPNIEWKFKSIPGPSKSDAGQKATITMEANQVEPTAGPAAVMFNGRVPNNSLELPELSLLNNANASSGSLIMDLGKSQGITAVNSYSWHENPPDQGSRGPQVYTLSGSSDGKEWTRITDVDTRPNPRGEKWNGQYGVSIQNASGVLGQFRFLRFDFKRTLSPLQPNPAYTSTLFAEIDVHTKESLSKAGDAEVVGPVQVTDVWVAFKTHCDIGYTETIENVLHKFRVPMMDIALGTIEKERDRPKNERFSWMLAGWPLRHVLGPQQDPLRRKRIEQAVREGAFGIGAIPFSFHSETGELETLTRGLGYASEIARKYNVPLPIAGKMTDVPSHSWIWPTLLTHAGVKFFQLGSNGNSGHLKVPHLFWWEGPDGSKLLCNYTADYGSLIVPPRNWPAKNYLAMIMTGDNHGPPSAQDVQNLRNVAAQYVPGARVHFGTLDDFAHAIAAENPQIPTIRGDMPDTWIHGWMSMPIEAKAARNCRPLQPVLDILNTQLGSWGLETGDLKTALGEVYENGNLYSEHTFGPAGPNVYSWNSGTQRDLYGDEWKAARQRGAYKKYEAAFDDKRAFARKESEIVQRELAPRLDLLAKSVNVSGNRIVVYNGLPWDRSGTVEVNGKSYFVKNVPAGGYVTITEESATQSTLTKINNNTLETGFYKVTFDLKRGGVSSLIEKRTGRELVDKTSPYALGQFIHETYDAERMRKWHLAYARPPGAQPLAFVKITTPPELKCTTRTPGNWTLKSSNNGTADVITLTSGDTLGLAKGISIVFTLPTNGPGIEVDWRVDEKTPDPTPEGAWLCFPFAVEQPKFLLGRLAAPIDPTKDIVEGANKDLFCLNGGMTIKGGNGAAVGLCPLDSPCISLGEPGLWKYTMGEISPKPTVFVNLYNNEWHTNFPEWTEGSWNSRVRIWPNDDLIVSSWEARTPLLAAVAEGPAGKLPKSQSGIRVSRPGVLVTAFGANPDGDGTLLRVWEQNGTSAELSIEIPGTFNEARPVDLRGEPAGQPIKIASGKLTIPLNAYTPKSFLLR